MDEMKNSSPSCPKCKNVTTERIPRPALMKVLMPWYHVRHYKCYKCFKTFYVKAVA